MKAYYISKEAIRQDDTVTWLRIGGREGVLRADGIDFVSFSSSVPGPLHFLFGLLRILIFCKTRAISLVYVDEWLYFQGRPLHVLVTELALKVAGIGFVLDQRDPFVDFQVAIGNLRGGSMTHKSLSFLYKIIYKLSNLVILPSEEYRDIMIREEGIVPEKLLGQFRGIDPQSFKVSLDDSSIRSKLGLEGKFVIGWFGIMHPFRLIREVLFPLIERIGTAIPGSVIIVGGNGPLRDELIKLKKSSPDAFLELGFISYDELPGYLAACDVLLCPINIDFRFTRSSLWLKVIESLAVGRPIIVSSTPATKRTYGKLKGIIWIEDPTPEKFLEAVKDLKNNAPSYDKLAKQQAKDLDKFTIKSTIPEIIDRVHKSL